jgi:hypothetical protein
MTCSCHSLQLNTINVWRRAAIARASLIRTHPAAAREFFAISKSLASGRGARVGLPSEFRIVWRESRETRV